MNTNFKMWSLFPFVARDIAVWVPEDIDKSKEEILSLVEAEILKKKDAPYSR